MKIGFFDSGLGGITIMESVIAMLPQYDYLYYGDTAHLPYGDKSEERIYTLTKQGIAYLFERGVKVAIVACNTASAQTLRTLQDTYLPSAYPDRKILGVIIPTIEELIASNSSHALLIGTNRTIASNKYLYELQKRTSTHLTLTQVATPELVPHIEQGEYRAAFRVLKPVLDSWRERIDTVILGCTHYTVLTEAIRTTYGDTLRVLSQTEIIPQKLHDYLLRHPEITMHLTTRGTQECILTKHNPVYAKSVHAVTPVTVS